VQELLKLLVSFAIQNLAKLIPALAGFMGGPFGWLGNIILGYITNWLVSLVERYGRFAGIDNKFLDVVKEAKASQVELKNIQANPMATSEQREKAIEAFKVAHRKFKLVPTRV